MLYSCTLAGLNPATRIEVHRAIKNNKFGTSYKFYLFIFDTLTSLSTYTGIILIPGL